MEVTHFSAKGALTEAELAVLWDQVRDGFVVDGSLTDIHVENTSEDQWQQFLEWLHAGPYKTEYVYGDHPLLLPKDPRELFLKREERHLIRIDIGDVWLHCHCFSVDEIELDIDQSEVNDPVRFGRLMRFIAGFAGAVGGDVIVTPENFKQGTFLVVHSS